MAACRHRRGGMNHRHSDRNLLRSDCVFEIVRIETIEPFGNRLRLRIHQELERLAAGARQRDIVREKCRLDLSPDDDETRPAATIARVARNSPPIKSGQRLCDAAAALV